MRSSLWILSFRKRWWLAKVICWYLKAGPFRVDPPRLFNSRWDHSFVEQHIANSLHSPLQPGDLSVKSLALEISRVLSLHLLFMHSRGSAVSNECARCCNHKKVSSISERLQTPYLRRIARPTIHDIWILSLKHSLLLSKWVQLIYKKRKRKARSLLHMSSMCVCMWTICVGHVGWWHPSRLQSSAGPAEVFSGFTCSVPPKHFFLPELNCVPREGERANHVSRGHFQSGNGLYLGPCGGRSRKRPATKNNKSSK